MNCRAASILVAISANLWRITWKLPIERPKALRSLAYSRVRSNIRCAPATAPAQATIRSLWSSQAMW